MGRMRIATALNIIALLAAITPAGTDRAAAQGRLAEAKIFFEDLSGARKLNPETNSIEMAFGWVDPDASGDPYTIVERLKDVALVASSVGDFVGKVQAPRLGCGDITLTVRYTGRYAVSLCADNGQVRALSSPARADGGAIRREILDSQDLDTDGDGVWEGAPRLALAQTPADGKVVYIAAIPATFFDIPADRVRPNLSLALTYAGAAAQQYVSIPLRDEFVLMGRPVRIGFMNHANRVIYVVQKTDAGTAIIADLTDMRQGDRLDVPADGIRVVEARRPARRAAGPRKGYALVQGLDGIPYNSFFSKAAAEYRAYELAKHFDISELSVSYFNWQCHKWDTDEGRSRRDGVIEHIQAYIDAAHRYGLKVALSHFACVYPGMSLDELKGAAPDFIGEDVDPNSGIPMKSLEQYGSFDVASPAALKWAMGTWRDTVGRLRDLDYLFYNEEMLFGGGHRDTSKDWALSLFSQAALEDYRRFIGDENAKFPIAKHIPLCERTFHTDSKPVWDKYYDWREYVYARFLTAHAAAAAEVNAKNPRYGGAIYFQHKDWQGRRYGIDLMECLDSPGVSWLVCEYATQPDDPQLVHFREVAGALGKKFSTFINVGYYEPGALGAVRLNTPQEVRRQFEMAVALGVDGICAYPGTWCNPASEAYDARMTKLWDALSMKSGFVDDHRLLPASPAEEIAAATRIRTDRKTAAVPRAPGPIAIDGDLQEWDVSAPVLINDKAQVRIGSQTWESEDDLSGRAYLCYDDASLYVAVDVRDGYVYLRGMGKGKYPVDFDTVDLFLGGFDPAAIRPGGAVKGHQVSITGVKDKSQPSVYNHTTAEHQLPGGEIAFRLKPYGYTIEMRIPWQAIHQFTPASGKRFAFDVAISDVDETGLEWSAGPPRERQMTWNATLPAWNSNGEWGIAELK